MVVWKTSASITRHSNNRFHLPVCFLGHSLHSLADFRSVLRICANSIQFLPGPLLAKFESDLGESAEGLGTHYQNSAHTLSNYLSPGAGGLMQVQQLFLGATWQKAEAEFVKAWHSVGAAVREGQEIGTFLHFSDLSNPHRNTQR